MVDEVEEEEVDGVDEDEEEEKVDEELEDDEDEEEEEEERVRGLIAATGRALTFTPRGRHLGDLGSPGVCLNDSDALWRRRRATCIQFFSISPPVGNFTVSKGTMGVTTTHSHTTHPTLAPQKRDVPQHRTQTLPSAAAVSGTYAPSQLQRIRRRGGGLAGLLV